MKVALTMGRSTRYDAKMISVPHGIKARPRWTITLRCDDWRVLQQRSREMAEWLDENMTNHRVHYRSAMSSSIEAITFQKHADAMVFYLRFI